MKKIKAQDVLKQMLKRHEGFRPKPYECTMGKLTIGYGRNLEDNGISLAEAEMMLSNDIDVCYAQAQKFEWFQDLDEPRKVVILSMIFNMGYPRFIYFKKMIAAVSNADYDKAADEMLSSLWSSQTGKRSTELAEIMRNGVL